VTQSVDRPKSKPARRQTCRSGGWEAEVFVNYVSMIPGVTSGYSLSLGSQSSEVLVKTGIRSLRYTCPRRDWTIRTTRHRRSVGYENRYRHAGMDLRESLRWL
jgi:hypothetical protein